MYTYKAIGQLDTVTANGVMTFAYDAQHPDAETHSLLGVDKKPADYFDATRALRRSSDRENPSDFAG